MKPKCLILHATGTNRDHDVSLAIELAGGHPEIVHINQLRNRDRQWADFQMLVLPGGFSYADALGAGQLLALDLQIYFGDEVQEFVNSGKPVIGICNGFQALIKSGILPEPETRNADRKMTLTHNENGHFECRWVTLINSSETCLWTKGLLEPIYCPVAHGEGRFYVSSTDDLDLLKNNDQVALVYAHPNGEPAGLTYPLNPNGSIHGIAGICNPKGNVLGLMPHPENHVFPRQFPEKSKTAHGNGLELFKNGVAYAKQI